MMNIWETLRIAKTRDAELIENAFRVLSGEFSHDSEEYKVIYQAYTEAMEYASEEEDIELLEEIFTNVVDKSEERKFDKLRHWFRMLMIPELSLKKRKEYMNEFSVEDLKVVLPGKYTFKYVVVGMLLSGVFSFNEENYILELSRNVFLNSGETNMYEIGHMNLKTSKTRANMVQIIMFCLCTFIVFASNRYDVAITNIFAAIVCLGISAWLFIIKYYIGMRRLKINNTFLNARALFIIFVYIASTLLAWPSDLLSIGTPALIFIAYIYMNKKALDTTLDTISDRFTLGGFSADNRDIINKIKSSIMNPNISKSARIALMKEFLHEEKTIELLKGDERSLFYFFVWYNKKRIRPLIPAIYSIIGEDYCSQMDEMDKMFIIYMKYETHLATEERIYRSVFSAICIFYFMLISTQNGYGSMSLFAFDFAYNYGVSADVVALGLLLIISAISYLRKQKYYAEYKKYFHFDYAWWLNNIVLVFMLALVNELGGAWAFFFVYVFIKYVIDLRDWW